MGTRKELIEAAGNRYREAPKNDKSAILDEFAALSGYHRKHAIRLLNGTSREPTLAAPRDRVYGEAVRQLLVLVWEASDRLCGKRLKALMPALLDAMHRHGHLSLEPTIRAKLLSMSAATIDRALRSTREKIDGQRKRRIGVGAAIRRSIAVRTFADWGDPPPGFLEVDRVEHCGGPKTDGNYVHSLVLTDIASGWTECQAMPVRNPLLIVQAMDRVATEMPFAMLGVDTDNDSAFMNETVHDYCKGLGLTQTRSRAYKKNDQAWVEQKNGAIVRRLLGYGRLSGHTETKALASLYAVSRLYINFFQPSFKLKFKTRDGARVKKSYHPPKTPCDRLLERSDVCESIKVRLRTQFSALDPVKLLQQIRAAQQVLANHSNGAPQIAISPPPVADVATFLSGLSTAWQAGEVRPTHRKKAGATHWWRSRPDPFEHVWPIIDRWLATEPATTAKQMMDRLATMVPDAYAGKAQLRTLQRRVKHWRQNQAKELILGHLRRLPGASAGAAEVAPALPNCEETTTQAG